MNLLLFTSFETAKSMCSVTSRTLQQRKINSYLQQLALPSVSPALLELSWFPSPYSCPLSGIARLQSKSWCGAGLSMCLLEYLSSCAYSVSFKQSRVRWRMQSPPHTTSLLTESVYIVWLLSLKGLDLSSSFQLVYFLQEPLPLTFLLFYLTPAVSLRFLSFMMFLKNEADFNSHLCSGNQRKLQLLASNITHWVWTLSAWKLGTDKRPFF